MKTKICLTGLVLALNLPAWGSLYSLGTLAPGGGSAIGAIPDNNTIGLTSQQNVSSESTLSALILTFVLQGGVSTDLSGYLRLGSGGSAPFYNLTSLIRNQTLSQTTPTTYTIDFNTPTFGSDFQTAFSGQNPNSSWTLFFADTSGGGITTLNGWSLDVNPVPEPVNVALAIFGGLLVVWSVSRRIKARLAGKTN